MLDERRATVMMRSLRLWVCGLVTFSLAVGALNGTSTAASQVEASRCSIPDLRSVDRSSQGSSIPGVERNNVNGRRQAGASGEAPRTTRLYVHLSGALRLSKMGPPFSSHPNPVIAGTATCPGQKGAIEEWSAALPAGKIGTAYKISLLAFTERRIDEPWEGELEADILLKRNDVESLLASAKFAFGPDNAEPVVKDVQGLEHVVETGDRVVLRMRLTKGGHPCILFSANTVDKLFIEIPFLTAGAAELKTLGLETPPVVKVPATEMQVASPQIQLPPQIQLAPPMLQLPVQVQAAQAGSTDAPLNRDLVDAAGRGDLDAVRALLDKGADPSSVNEDGVGGLFRASAEGHQAIVKLLLARGARVNQRFGPFGLTVLRIATQEGQTEVVRLLLAAGADPNAKDGDGQSPLWTAVANKRVEVVRVLLAGGASLTTPEGQSVVRNSPDPAITQLLIEAQRRQVGTERLPASESPAPPSVRPTSAGATAHLPFAIRDERFVDWSFSGTATTDIGLKDNGDILVGVSPGTRVATLQFFDGYPVLFGHGSRHTLIGRVNLHGYVFDSDKDEPLLFEVDRDLGYVYRGGKGRVTPPDRASVALPRATETTAATTASESVPSIFLARNLDNFRIASTAPVALPATSAEALRKYFPLERGNSWTYKLVLTGKWNAALLPTGDDVNWPDTEYDASGPRVRDVRYEIAQSEQISPKLRIASLNVNRQPAGRWEASLDEASQIRYFANRGPNSGRTALVLPAIDGDKLSAAVIHEPESPSSRRYILDNRPFVVKVRGGVFEECIQVIEEQPGMEWRIYSYFAPLVGLVLRGETDRQGNLTRYMELAERTIVQMENPPGNRHAPINWGEAYRNFLKGPQVSSRITGGYWSEPRVLLSVGSDRKFVTDWVSWLDVTPHDRIARTDIDGKTSALTSDRPVTPGQHTVAVYVKIGNPKGEPVYTRPFSAWDGVRYQIDGDWVDGFYQFDTRTVTLIPGQTYSYKVVCNQIFAPDRGRTGTVRIECFASLTNINNVTPGADMLQDLVHLAAAGDAAARKTAIGTLYSLVDSTKDPVVTTTTITVLRDHKEPTTLQCAIPGSIVSGDLRKLGVVDALVGALGDPEERIRQWSACALWRLPDARAVDPLVGKLRDSDGLVRQCAVHALGVIKDARALEPLIASMADAVPTVREQAALSLGCFKDPRPVESLIGRLKDGEVGVRCAAAASLGAIGESLAKPALIESLRDTAADVRRDAAASLGSMSGFDAIEALIGVLKDRDRSVLESAANSLKTLTGEDYRFDQDKWRAWLRKARK